MTTDTYTPLPDAHCWTHHVDGEHNWHKVISTGRIICWTCTEKENA